MSLSVCILTPSTVPQFVACVASVSVWFWSKEIPRKGTFGFDRARNETRAKKWKRGSLTCATFLAVFDSRSSFFSPKPHRNACYAGYTVCVHSSKGTHTFLGTLKISKKRFPVSFISTMSDVANVHHYSSSFICMDVENHLMIYFCSEHW